MSSNKYVIYQIMTRLFGNRNSHNAPWGTIEQNGVGKLSQITDQALVAIRDLGITHLWLTGIPQHASLTDNTKHGVHSDHPAVVKGRAGSPYAIKDYFSVHPDLADNPSASMAEFESLVQRAHMAGLKVLIDLVPNHVARQYQALAKPAQVGDFGEHDNDSVEYAPNNNFYYLPHQPFTPPKQDATPSITSPGSTPTAPYLECPAKWTGNGARHTQPTTDDWYDTVKINFGVRPDGQCDFPLLPMEIRYASYQTHTRFWQDKPLPNSWHKFAEISHFWLDKGVDGFRYDMAEMVPVEFWSYLNSTIKNRKPDAFLLAEVYQPDKYRDYIHAGKMDYLYDKVDLYDALVAIMRGQQSTQILADIQARMADISHHMLGFLENHDEQRLASTGFLAQPELARPALLICATLRNSPSLIYFGQEVGEPATEVGGYGQPSRTSIFDYVGVPHHQRWMNNGRFDGGLLSDSEKQLRAFYRDVLTFSLNSPALTGTYHDLYTVNQSALGQGRDHCFLFARSVSKAPSRATLQGDIPLHGLVIIASNFHPSDTYRLQVTLPQRFIQSLDLADGSYALENQLGQTKPITLNIKGSVGKVLLTLPPFAALAYQAV